MTPNPHLPAINNDIEGPSAPLEEHGVRKPRSTALLKEELEHAQGHPEGVSSVNSPGKLKVILAGVEVSYEVDHVGHVLITSASPAD